MIPAHTNKSIALPRQLVLNYVKDIWPSNQRQWLEQNVGVMLQSYIPGPCGGHITVLSPCGGGGGGGGEGGVHDTGPKRGGGGGGHATIISLAHSSGI